MRFGSIIILFVFIYAVEVRSDNSDTTFRQCEPIRIEMCRNIGYNETSMPNLLGMELQTDINYTLQTFMPLIEYVCSTQLKLFLCSAYVPMCTSKVATQPIGPCRSLCESVRSRCHPILQGFGFPWPPALDCARFPKENNHETMCMEGPGEAHLTAQEQDIYGMGGLNTPKLSATGNHCPGIGKSLLYVKLHRSGRCAPRCDADILFGSYEKHLSEIWVTTWSFAVLGIGIIAALCIIFSDDTKTSSKWSSMLTPLVWCQVMVASGWAVRLISGRVATSCGYDPQWPNVSLLLVDGLSNASCAATFLLRYYFGMAACVWWAILCLGWHREVRRNNPDTIGHISLDVTFSTARRMKMDLNIKKKCDNKITQSNFARFAAYGLPGFQTAAVIVARLIDADELLGACFVGNQSDKGLQVFVATPFFCYWIFGSMNLISGYLVYRRGSEIGLNKNAQGVHQTQHAAKRSQSGIGTFLLCNCILYATLLVAVIYEFANIDVWLNVPPNITAKEGFTTPLWPFLTRTFMELLLGQTCFAWVLGPKISTTYKRQITPRQFKLKSSAPQATPQSSRGSNVAYSTVSYQTVRQTPQNRSTTTMSMNQMSNCVVGRVPKSQPMPLTHIHMNHSRYKQAQAKLHAQQLHKYNGNETIL